MTTNQIPYCDLEDESEDDWDLKHLDDAEEDWSDEYWEDEDLSDLDDDEEFWEEHDDNFN